MHHLKDACFNQLTDYVTKPMIYCHQFRQEFIMVQIDRETRLLQKIKNKILLNNQGKIIPLLPVFCLLFFYTKFFWILSFPKADHIINRENLRKSIYLSLQCAVNTLI